MPENNSKAKTIAANFMLIFVAIIWGGGFVVMKNTLSAISPNYILAFRFSVAAVGLSFTLIKYRKSLNKSAVLSGMLMGLLMYGGFAVQTYGLMYTTAGKNAFITGAYVVIVPLLLWLTNKQRPRPIVLAACVACFIGVGILSVNEKLSINIGDLLTLFSAVFYALHIVAVDKFVGRHPVMLLTFIQFATMSLLSWIAALSFEKFPTVITGDIWWALAYSGFIASLLALTLQNIGIMYASTDYASMLMSTEAVFGCIFGVIFLKEVISARMAVGILIIVAALFVAQMPEKKKKTAEELPQANMLGDEQESN